MSNMTIRAAWIRCSGACLLAAASGLLLASCGDDAQPKKPPGNRPPVISRVYHDPPRVLRNHRVSAIAVTSDPDNDLLGHIWTADRGVFPAGYGLRVVPWISPQDHGTSTLRVSVSDGEFTVRDSVVIETMDLDPPGGLSFIAGSSVVDLAWERGPDEGVDHWTGYEVFMAQVPISSIPEEDLGRHRVGFVQGAIRQYRRGGLTRGTLYHFAIGSLRGWGAWIEDGERWEIEERSGPGQEVVLSPRPEWPAHITEFGHPGGSFALNLSAGSVRRLDVHDPSVVAERDLYFGTADPMDGPGPIWMKSVSLLANRHEGWSERVVRLKLLGNDWSVNTTTDDGWSEQIAVDIGLVYAVLLPEGNFAKIQITSIVGAHPYRQIQLQWAYQTIPGFPVF